MKIIFMFYNFNNLIIKFMIIFFYLYFEINNNYNSLNLFLNKNLMNHL